MNMIEEIGELKNVNSVWLLSHVVFPDGKSYRFQTFFENQWSTLLHILCNKAFEEVHHTVLLNFVSNHRFAYFDGTKIELFSN